MDFIPFLARDQTLLERAWSFATYPVHVLFHPLEALASLPMLSFFIIPAFSSYTTTINFLFFYMTWAILISSNPPLLVELYGTLAVRTFFYILPSAGFLAFDSLLPELAKGMKEHGRDALAMSEEHGGLHGRWWRIVLISVANILSGIVLQLSVDVLLVKVARTRGALRITTSVPFPWMVAQELFFGLILREVVTYIFHRYFLHGKRSSRPKKWHRSWQHSVGAPWSFVAHYDHPVPYLIHVFLPMYLPAVFLRMHLLTFMIYLSLVSLEEVFAYSGYNILPTAFVLGGIARRQERHLMSGGQGNYGAVGLVDFMCGTSLGDQDFLDDMIDEAEERQLPQKARKSAKKLQKRVKNTVESESDSAYIEDQTDGEDATEDSEGDSNDKRRKKRARPASTSLDRSKAKGSVGARRRQKQRSQDDS